jgi:choloylglycine hydrolase
MEIPTKLYSAFRPLLLAFIVSSCATAQACTDFQLQSTDGAYISGRSMEWGQPLASKLNFHTRGETHQTLAQSGKPGSRWTSHYGYVAADAYGVDTVVDGMNERGLVFSALWMPGSVYQNVAKNEEADAIDFIDLGANLLGTCSSVDEAVTVLRSHRIWCSPIKQMGGAPTLHLALHDASGKNAVIEFINSEQKMYDNPNGVLTNAPTFDWHQTNLRNYIHIDASNPKPVIVAGTVLEPPGQGSGFLGIPGDWTPPSRFIRATAMRSFAKPVATADEAVTLAAHILNAVDIPIGAIRDGKGNLAQSDYTQWAMIKDSTNKKLYYRGYNDLSLKLVDLNQIDWSKPAMPASLPLDK